MNGRDVDMTAVLARLSDALSAMTDAVELLGGQRPRPSLRLVREGEVNKPPRADGEPPLTDGRSGPRSDGRDGE